jgi:hypothetical protein
LGGCEVMERAACRPLQNFRRAMQCLLQHN